MKKLRNISLLLLAFGLISAAELTSAPHTITAVGTVRAHQTSILGAQVSGRVAAVLVDVGDRVSAGQELIRLDPIFFQLAVAAYQAELISAKARLTTLAATLAATKANSEASEAEVADAKLNLTRMQALWEKPAGTEPSIPKRLYDEAITRHRTMLAKLAAAQAAGDEVRARTSEAESAIISAEVALKHAEQNLHESVVRAPYAGVVTRRLVDAGGSVTSAPATDLMEIQEIAQLFLECAVPQELLPKLSNGLALHFTIDGVEGARKATISTIFPTIDPANRAVRLRAELDNRDGLLRPGLLVAVTIALP